MNVLNNYSAQNVQKTPVKDNIQVQTEVQPKQNLEQKPDVLDIFSEKIVNKRDINDTVKVPRSIFKGYLCFTAGTALCSIGTTLDKGKISKGINIAGSLLTILGTFNFVKPYLIKNNNLTNKEK